MKRNGKSQDKKEVFEFHFIVDKDSTAAEFVEEADTIGRSYTEHFRRILDKVYKPQEK